MASDGKGVMGKLGQWLATPLVWLATLLLIALAPALVLPSIIQRERYRRLSRRAEPAQAQLEADALTLLLGEQSIRVEAPAGRVVLWDWYYHGGTASNDELECQLLVCQVDGRQRVFELDVVSYDLARELRARGLRVRNHHAVSASGILMLFALFGVVLWIGIAAVVWREMTRP